MDEFVHVDTSLCYVIEPNGKGEWIAWIHVGEWRRVGRDMRFTDEHAAAQVIDEFDRQLRNLAFLHTDTMQAALAELNSRSPWA